MVVSGEISENFTRTKNTHHMVHFQAHVLEIADDSMVPTHTCISVTMYNIVHSTVITLGYVQTAVSVFESAGVAELTVAISVPNPSLAIETSFFLLVNTSDRSATAAGLSSCLDQFDVHTPTHFSIHNH